MLLVSERFTAPCSFLYMRVAHDKVFQHLWVTWFTFDNHINHNINFISIYQDWWYCMAYQYICWRPWMLEWKNASWVCTLSPFALLMARRGLSTRNTRRIFTTEIALELNTKMTTNKWMNQWITELSDRWTLTARRKRWGTHWRPEGPGGWRRFCRRNLDEGKLHTQSPEQHTFKMKQKLKLHFHKSLMILHMTNPLSQLKTLFLRWFFLPYFSIIYFAWISFYFFFVGFYFNF